MGRVDSGAQRVPERLLVGELPEPEALLDRDRERARMALAPPTCCHLGGEEVDEVAEAGDDVGVELSLRDEE